MGAHSGAMAGVLFKQLSSFSDDCEQAAMHQTPHSRASPHVVDTRSASFSPNPSGTPPPLHTPCKHSQQYLECEHAQLVFGEGGARAVSYPVRKLCALLPLPRLASLQPRLVAHVVLLASLWLPRDASALVDFFQDAVELLQVNV